MTDVLEELDRWLRGSVQAEPHLILQRARDEIVALRVQLEAVKGIAGNERKLSEAIIRQARAEALEEAAQRCDRLATDYTIPISADNWSAGCQGCAGRIRALKEKRDE